MNHQKIQELDVVALTVDLPALKLVRGQVGTVVFVYPPNGFEVEFADEGGHTSGLVTLNATELLRLHYKPVAV